MGQKISKYIRHRSVLASGFFLMWQKQVDQFVGGRKHIQCLKSFRVLVFQCPLRLTLLFVVSRSVSDTVHFLSVLEVFLSNGLAHDLCAG